MKGFLNVVELGHYTVQADVPYSFLKKGQEVTAFLVQSFGIEYILMGCSTLDTEYFDFLLWYQFLARDFEKDM